MQSQSIHKRQLREISTSHKGKSNTTAVRVEWFPFHELSKIGQTDYKREPVCQNKHFLGSHFLRILLFPNRYLVVF